LPSLRFAYDSPSGHLVTETVAAMIGALVALLVYGRFRTTHGLRHLLLAYSLALLAVAAFGFAVVPRLAGVSPDHALMTWAPLALRVVAGLLLLTAACLPAWSAVGAAPPGRDLAIGSAVVVALWGAAVLLDGRLPDAVIEQPSAVESVRPVLEGHPVVLGAQLLLLGCFAGASVMFTIDAERRRDDVLVRWLGAGAALGACARLNYALFPSMYSDWLYTGDLLRIGFYLLLLVGAVAEITAYWERRVDEASAAERARLARELHDGAVQELGYIWTQSKTMVRRPNVATAQQILSAAERALDETRGVVDALSGVGGEALADSVRRAACDVGDRYDVPVTLGLDASVNAPEGHREALVRIVREAIGNAARHGHPSVVEVALEPGLLRVRDDGDGFDTTVNGRAGGFGLRSMRDRANGIGATLDVQSQKGRGTTVRVSW
jgi:signal transduction histidine kinase